MEDEQLQAVVAAGGDNVLLAWEDGRVQLLDAQRLEVLKEFAPEGRNQPRFAVASPRAIGSPSCFTIVDYGSWTPASRQSPTFELLVREISPRYRFQGQIACWSSIASTASAITI